MVNFFIKRLIGLIFVLVGVTFITFILGYKAPGDPIQLMLGNHFNLALYHQLRHIYGLDLPWYQQYFDYLGNLIHLNFGLSFQQQGQSVWSILSQGVPVSLELGFWGLLLTFALGIPLGILSALRANTWIDTTNMGIMLFLYAIPVFVLAVLAQVVIVWFDQHAGANWPPTGWGNPWQYTGADIEAKLIPIIIYAVAGIAYLARLVRTSVLEVLRQDYIRTARAKGASEASVNYHHALKNAVLPVITVIGIEAAFLIGGLIVTETVFNIPGIARFLVEALRWRDYPIVQNLVMFIAVVVVVVNFTVDMLYAAIDPRIRYGD
jgi:ABC-type dipeptide/oligopeptide/nickel transport system permease component